MLHTRAEAHRGWDTQAARRDRRAEWEAVTDSTYLTRATNLATKWMVAPHFQRGPLEEVIAAAMEEAAAPLRDEVSELRDARQREEWWEELLTHYDAPVTGIRDKHRNQELRRLIGLDAKEGK